ncbi:uncharacterized protein [Drosophila takahashii]|uniref:uncharacterized protein n=1 Tax=Drosophila takahashii TaxID=29030 RepID=UPI003899232D
MVSGLPHLKQNLFHSVDGQSRNPCSAAPQFQQPGLNGFLGRPRISSTSRISCSSTSSGMRASLTRNLFSCPYAARPRRPNVFSTSTHSSRSSSTAGGELLNCVNVVIHAFSWLLLTL